jgi:CRISPR-associated protein Csx17
VPTPVLSPWNGGSGFGPNDKEPLRRLDALRRHPSPRLAGLRSAIEMAEGVVSDARAAGWITDSGVSDKDRVVLEFRNRCPDELVPWIDAAIVLADRSTFFPPILGTGGNDGRLEFSTNFHQQLIDVIGSTEQELVRSYTTAKDLLAGTQGAPLAKIPIGQFDPGGAGGPGSSRFGAAGSLANPWSYVLVVEGSLLFAASAARRHQHAAGRAAMPFTVFTSPDGSVSGAAGEESRGEVWAPVWGKEFTLAEIQQVFAEARAAWRGRPARRAVDFYAATRSLGVARGIDEFVRYGLQRRNGLAFAAVSLDRVVVREKAAVQLTAQVEDWASRAGVGDASTAVAEASRGFDKAHLEFAHDGEPEALARMLAALTTLEMAVARSRRAKQGLGPRYAPPAHAFLGELARIGTAELRVAVGIASCATSPAKGPGLSMRQILLPVDPGDWRDAPIVSGFGVRPLASVLADVLIWRSRTAVAEHAGTDHAGGEHSKARFRGIPTFRSGIPVPAADLHALAAGRLDDKALDQLLRACLALNWRNVRHQWEPQRLDLPVATLGLLHPLAAGLRPGNAPGQRAGEPADEPVPALSPAWAARLAAGQVTQVHQEAAARLRQAGWTAVGAPPAQPEVSGTQIAAALVPRCLRPKAVLRIFATETNPLTEE